MCPLTHQPITEPPAGCKTRPGGSIREVGSDIGRAGRGHVTQPAVGLDPIASEFAAHAPQDDQISLPAGIRARTLIG